MSERMQQHEAEKKLDEGREKSAGIIDEDCDEMYALDTLTSVDASSRRKANLDAYKSLWLMLLRMEADGTLVGDRREEEEEPDENGTADTQRLIYAGVCIPEATSQVLRYKEYKLRWSGTTVADFESIS